MLQIINKHLDPHMSLYNPVFGLTLFELTKMEKELMAAGGFEPVNSSSCGDTTTFNQKLPIFSETQCFF